MTSVPQIAVSAVGPVVVATLSGEIDAANVGAISATTLRAIGDATVGLVVDLSDVRYIDSSGIQMLFQFARELALRRQGLGLLILGTSPVRRLIKITSLDNVAICCESIDECVEALCAQAAELY